MDDRAARAPRSGTTIVVPSAPSNLTVAVTGPTGTFGFGLIPLLQRERAIEGIVGIARRPFDPAAHGWTKMEYRRGDVREPEALRAALAAPTWSSTSHS